MPFSSSLWSVLVRASSKSDIDERTLSSWRPTFTDLPPGILVLGGVEALRLRDEHGEWMQFVPQIGDAYTTVAPANCAPLKTQSRILKVVSQRMQPSYSGHPAVSRGGLTEGPRKRRTRSGSIGASLL